MMSRDPIAQSDINEAEKNLNELARAHKSGLAVTMERQPIEGRIVEDLSGASFCPIGPNYWELALSRHLAGRSTRVFEVTTWNSVNGGRFRLKS